MTGTKRACIIGWPVEHSRSPLIHTYWLKKYSIDGEYTKKAVRPEDLRNFLETFQDSGFLGANITVPHKEAALSLVDEADQAATAIGAANTLWLDAGKLFASNTDHYGFMTYLKETVPDWNREDRPVVVLGAGGAARGIVYGLLNHDVEQIRICNRTMSRAEALSHSFGKKVKPVTWQKRSHCLDDAGLLINTTALGMIGHDPIEIDLAHLPSSATVADIVYAPLETQLLSQARSRGLATVDGLGMLLHQAVPGFHKWFGVRPVVTGKLKAAVIADLEI